MEARSAAFGKHHDSEILISIFYHPQISQINADFLKDGRAAPHQIPPHFNLRKSAKSVDKSKTEDTPNQFAAAATNSSTSSKVVAHEHINRAAPLPRPMKL